MPEEKTIYHTAERYKSTIKSYRRMNYFLMAVFLLICVLFDLFQFRSLDQEGQIVFIIIFGVIFFPKFTRAAW